MSRQRYMEDHLHQLFSLGVLAADRGLRHTVVWEAEIMPCFCTVSNKKLDPLSFPSYHLCNILSSHVQSWTAVLSLLILKQRRQALAELTNEGYIDSNA